MITRAFKKVTAELEELIRFDIPIDRAIDLLEASTQNLEELIVLNTVRETLSEMREETGTASLDFLYSANVQAPSNQTTPFHA